MVINKKLTNIFALTIMILMLSASVSAFSFGDLRGIFSLKQKSVETKTVQTQELTQKAVTTQATMPINVPEQDCEIITSQEIREINSLKRANTFIQRLKLDSLTIQTDDCTQTLIINQELGKIARTSSETSSTVVKISRNNLENARNSFQQGDLWTGIKYARKANIPFGVKTRATTALIKMGINI